MANIFESSIREYDYEKVCGGLSEKDYPSYYELPRTVSVKNQVVDKREILACAACSIAITAEYLWGKEFSEGFAYSELRDSTHDGPGMYISKALDMFRKIGIVPLSDFGTLLEMPDLKELVRKFPELYDIAKDYTIGGHASLYYSDTSKRDKAIKDALLRDGVALISSSNRYFGGNHAFVIVGWNDETDSYIYQNSYGKEFGDQGRSEIPKSKIDCAHAVFLDMVDIPFIDVDKSRWSYKHIKNMYLAGIINGKSKDSFDPEGYITREEASAMFDRSFEKFEEKLERIYKQLSEKGNI